MYIVWEGKPMRKILSILLHEYKMQMRRPATWGVFLAANTVAMLDSFPSASNLARLEFLPQPAYFIHRTLSLYGIILMFGLMFLLSGRFPADSKGGIKSLFMAAPVKKTQYLLGKLLGGFLYTFTVFCLFLFLNTMVHAVFSPASNSVAEYLFRFGKAVAIGILPISFFIGFCAVAFPAFMDIRLFYVVISAVFMYNATVVGNADRMPFYVIMSGDLMKLLWQHPKFPFNDTASMAANLAFLIGCGVLSFLLVLFRRKFWRAG